VPASRRAVRLRPTPATTLYTTNVDASSGRLPEVPPPATHAEAPPPPGDEATQGLDRVRRTAAFLSRVPPFDDLTREAREDLAKAVTERRLAAGESLLVEGGPPGTELFVVAYGILEFTTRGQVVDLVMSGGVVGHPTLVTGLAPEISVRAKDDCLLYAIPREVAIAILSRPQGVAFVARTLRDRLLKTARMLPTASDTRNVPVSSLIRRPASICTPETTIREAAQRMTQEVVSAVLVETRAGFGIVSNADLRDKVIAAGLSPETPVSAIMTTPVLTIRDDQLATEASVEMLRAGINHLVAVDAGGRVVGIVSAASLMAPDALSPIALRWSIAAAHDEGEVVAAAKLIPDVFVSLVETHLDAAVISRIVTLQSDALTQRLLELAIKRHGPPPVPYAWLALGSSGRSELTLASDQDNALAYADTDDPAVDGYFALLAAEVNRGLAECGFKECESGVMARDHHWRMSQSRWLQVFNQAFETWDFNHTLRACVAFDFRRVTGDLDIVTPLVNVLLQARDHPSFLSRLARMVTDIRSPLGFRQRLAGPVDIKKSALLPIQNMARYYALANRVTTAATLDRLAAVQALGRFGAAEVASLPEAFKAMWNLRLCHHAAALRAGRGPDDALDSTHLRPLTFSELQQSLRLIAAAQKLVP